MSDTPRTDKLMAFWDDDGATRGPAFRELRDLCRQLERELAEVKLQAEKWANLAADAEAEMVKAQRDLGYAERRIFDLEQAATDPEYAKVNPLGGPARMFDVIADRIRAGEDYNAVLKDYGLDAEAQRDAERYRFLRGKSMLGGNQFYSRIMEIHDEEIDKARGA